jgi:diacylglycerol kinase (ATP)
MSLKHLVFIINPRSGVDREKAISKAVEERLDKSRFTYEIDYTERPKHGIELARQAAEKGAYAVVAVGGDGSVNDVVKGLVGTDTALAIIPKGSGNGMARTMEIPLELMEAIDVINTGKLQSVDIGYANDSLFLSNAGVGFDALISKRFAKKEKRGFATYSWLVTQHLWTYKEWDWQIKIDGKELSQKAFMINVANGQQFGYNFKIAPNADYADGWLDVTIIKPFPKILGGTLVFRAMTGSIDKSPYVETYRAKEVTISNPALKLMQTDGDAHPCSNEINYRIEPAALKVVLPDA